MSYTIMVSIILSTLLSGAIYFGYPKLEGKKMPNGVLLLAFTTFIAVFIFTFIELEGTRGFLEAIHKVFQQQVMHQTH